MAGIAAIPVQQLRGVGPKLTEKLADYGIREIQDLLFHFPLRYQDRTKITPIAAAREGLDLVIEGEIKLADIVYGKRRSLVARIQDGSGTLSLRFFHFSGAQKNNFQPGTRLRCFGQVRRGSAGLEMYHPEYRQVELDEEVQDQTLTPVYPTSSGIGQNQWRSLCTQALGYLAQEKPEDLLPASCEGTISLANAIRYLHAPPPGAQLELLREGTHPAQLQLALEELTAHKLSLNALRESHRQLGAPPLPPAPNLMDAFLARLGFDLTVAQGRVNAEISTDLSKPIPMLRLLQGDVGSGKTVVAACAALQAISNGYQVAIMAPTEILAEQHWQTFSSWFEPLDIPMEWLTGRLKGKKRQQACARIASGEAAFVTGTHALFQADVEFAKLGLVIVDEQHRFGVHQRLALTEKAQPELGRPHQLVMTATPIPRTLSMVAYADLDCSVINELPPGRVPVSTVLIDSSRRPQIVQRVARACQQGRQVYWVCTLIEESETLQAQAAEAVAQELRLALPELAIGLVHGRLKPPEKAAVMASFKAGDIALLVATTVIEVGVDVANASVMIIENPERLGLAQLHQLRGRVGRGGDASHCVLLYQAPLSANGKQRLTTLRESSDGFIIAEKDLQLRGPGEVLGVRQTGLMEFRVAQLPRHENLLDRVDTLAALLLDQYPERVGPLIQRWTGNAARFGTV